MDLEKTEAINACAGEDQQEFNRQIDCDIETRVGVNGQGLRPWGTMRQSVTSKNVNTEAGESMALEAIAKQRLVKTQ
jgi:hypothetical protein